MYFQFMLRKALEKANIPYIYAEENLTYISKKVGFPTFYDFFVDVFFYVFV